MLAEFAPIVVSPPERYWKVPEWYEYTCRLQPATEAGFDRVLASTLPGWHHVVRDGECNAVWNAEPGHTFLLPEVTWAEVWLMHPPEQVQP